MSARPGSQESEGFDVIVRAIATEITSIADVEVEVTEPSPSWKTVRLDVTRGRRTVKVFEDSGALVASLRSRDVAVPRGAPRELAYFLLGLLQAAR